MQQIINSLLLNFQHEKKEKMKEVKSKFFVKVESEKDINNYLDTNFQYIL